MQRDDRSSHPTRLPVEQGMRIRGRWFSPAEIAYIEELVRGRDDLSRRALSFEVCDALEWYQPNGRPKDRACRDVLLTLHRNDIIELPAPQYDYKPPTRCVEVTERTAAREPIEAPAGTLAPIIFEIVTGNEAVEESLWNEYIERYHYLGYTPVVGAQIKYVLRCEQGMLGCMAFGSPAWNLKPRDSWIGWSAEQRKARLQRIVNQTRFLILPWVRSKNLASMLLGAAARRLPDDWQKLYGYRPWLVETFVDTELYAGTCYKAANWRHVGQTAGRGKYSTSKKQNRSQKAIFVYPLVRSAKRRLCADVDEHPPINDGGAGQ